jgi:prophage regulatory protein
MTKIIKSSAADIAVTVEQNRILRLSEVTRLTGRSRASIYRDMAVHRFPRQVAIGLRAVGWRFQDIAEHLEKITAELA